MCLRGSAIGHDLTVANAQRGGGDQSLAWVLPISPSRSSGSSLSSASSTGPSGDLAGLRGLCPAMPIIPMIVGLNFVYVVAIPTRFLIEPDTADERDAWPVECIARRRWIPQIAAPPCVSR
jgi:hypothetical protein